MRGLDAYQGHCSDGDSTHDPASRNHHHQRGLKHAGLRCETSNCYTDCHINPNASLGLCGLASNVGTGAQERVASLISSSLMFGSGTYSSGKRRSRFVVLGSRREDEIEDTMSDLNTVANDAATRASTAPAIDGQTGARGSRHTHVAPADEPAIQRTAASMCLLGSRQSRCAAATGYGLAARRAIETSPRVP